MAVNKCLVAVVELEGKESGATGWVSVYGINEKDGDGLPVAVIADRVAASISSNPNLLWQFNQSKLLTLQQKTNKQPTSQVNDSETWAISITKIDRPGLGSGFAARWEARNCHWC